MSGLNPKQPQATDRLQHAVTELMEEREDILVTFSTILSFDSEDIVALKESLARLTQLLTDYSALAHFEVIDPILVSLGLKEADDVKLIAAIQDSTEYILGFTDEYSGSAGESHNLLELSEALNGLGERLAERFELEDSLFSRIQTH